MIRFLIRTRKVKAQVAATRRTRVSFVLFVWSLQAEIPSLLKLVIIAYTNRGALNRKFEEIVRSFKEISPSKILQAFSIRPIIAGECCGQWFSDESSEVLNSHQMLTAISELQFSQRQVFVPDGGSSGAKQRVAVY